MPAITLETLILFAAAIPFIFYLLAIYSAARYFWSSKHTSEKNLDFTPAVSILKPVRGLDPGAYENFASFCRQDYPDYELIFCATDRTDPSVPVIQKLIQDFPDRQIRLLYSAGHTAINDKVAKLRLMEREAQHEYLVINDSDVRVEPDYLRTVVAPLREPKVGGVTCFYASVEDKTFVENLQTIGMISDFYAGVLVASELDGIHFALGPTMVSTKQRVAGFGGFQALENRPADDLLFGRLIAEQGYEIKLLPYTVETVPDFQGFGQLISKRLRWMTVMRSMRPWGHFGLLFTWGLPWTTLAVLVHPRIAVAAIYWGLYLNVSRNHHLAHRDSRIKTEWSLEKNAADSVVGCTWRSSFGWRVLRVTTIRWRGVDYQTSGRTLRFRHRFGSPLVPPEKSNS